MRKTKVHSENGGSLAAPFFFCEIGFLTMRLIEYKYPNNEIKVVLCQSVARSRPSPCSDSSSLAERSDHSLDISSKLETPVLKVASGYGEMGRRTVFGRNAIHRILCAGGAMDALEGGASRQVFCTGTLPGSTRSAKETIAKFSSFLVHRLKAWINKIVPAKLDFYVWELQKRGALHLHYVVRCETDEQIEKIITGFKNQWIRLLETVNKLSGIDVFARAWGGTWLGSPSVVQADAQRVNKSVGAYLSCYLKKGASKHDRDNQSPYFPVRWFGISRPLSSVIARMSEKREFEIVGRRAAERAFERRLEKYEPHSVKSTEFRHKYGTGKTFVGYFDKQELEEIWSMDRFSWKVLSTGSVSNTQQLIYAIVSHWQSCLSRRRHSLPKSKLPYLEDAFAKMTQIQNGGYRFNRQTCRDIEFLGRKFGLNWTSQSPTIPMEQRLIALTRLYWEMRKLADFRWDGSCENEEEICNFLDSRSQVCYFGTNSDDEQGTGESGGHIIADKPTPVGHQVDLWEQLGLL